jgi:hypothetical protein
VTALTVETLKALPVPLIGPAYDRYERMFDELRTQAIQRHLMTQPEFSDVASDERVTKVIVRDGEDIAGLATVGNDLGAFPLIEPAYFRARWPEEYEQHRIFYVGFIGTVPELRGTGVVQQLFETVTDPMIAANGIGFADYCTVRAETMPRATALVMRRLRRRVQVSFADSQEYYLYDFRTPDPEAPR